MIRRDQYLNKLIKKEWNGRIKVCRGIGASLTEQEILAWEQEHMMLLQEIVAKIKVDMKR